NATRQMIILISVPDKSSGGSSTGYRWQLGDSIEGPFFFMSYQDALTALAGGGQTGATAILASVARFTTVATAGDSSLLPASLPGSAITVINSGVASMNVFPAVGDLINNLAANTAIPVAAGAIEEFYCTVTGKWQTFRGLAPNINGYQT